MFDLPVLIFPPTVIPFYAKHVHLKAFERSGTAAAAAAAAGETLDWMLNGAFPFGG